MRKTVLVVLFLCSLISNAQYRGTRQRADLVRTETYVTNSPGNSASTSWLTGFDKDSIVIAYGYPAFQLWKFKSYRNDGYPTSIAWFDSDGYIKRSPLPSWLTSESDPLWLIDKSNYFDKTTSDARYLQSFTELDPQWFSVSANYRTKIQNDLLYVSLSGSYINPSWITSLPYSKITGTPIIYSFTGNSTQYVKGDGTYGRRAIPYSGTTSGSGTYSVTFSSSYSVAPNIQANIVGGTPNQFITMVVSTTGFTVTVYQRNTVNLLATEILLGTTVLVNGSNVDVLITEK